MHHAIGMNVPERAVGPIHPDQRDRSIEPRMPASRSFFEARSTRAEYRVF
jgi:hypothetical protein